jgi:hypothetical protein
MTPELQKALVALREANKKEGCSATNKWLEAAWRINALIGDNYEPGQ